MKYLFLFLASLSFGVLHAQLIFQENFESGSLPDGWSIESNATDGGWNIGTASGISSGFFGIPDNDTGFLIGTNDDECNCDKSNERLFMPAIDLSDVNSAILRFNLFYSNDNYQGAQESAEVEISTDNSNWETLKVLLGNDSWNSQSIDLENYIGNETVYIAFKYDDDGGWVYGMAIDEVVVEVPALLEANLLEVAAKAYGESNKAFPMTATVYNQGISTITALEMSYSVNGGDAVTENFDNLNVVSFSDQVFEFSMPWIPTEAGIKDVEVKITAINGTIDENTSNNTATFTTEIFGEVIVPNLISNMLNSNPIITEMAGAAEYMDGPTDLKFFPILGKNELWVINQRTESSGGSTLTITDASSDAPSNFDHRVDGNAWHFMALPTALAFSSDNYNFASSPGIQDANHSGGTFTGPTLWSSDPDIYARPSGGNGSHLDMLHGSPFSMGIAHEVDNAFWVYDDWNKDIVRYDFVEDHGPGNSDHSDGRVRRYQDMGLATDSDIPNHMILDKDSGWLYIVDNGNDRVIRLDINSGAVAQPLAFINEQLAEHTSVEGFNTEVIVDTGLDMPCGIALFENYLMVGDYATGDINVYDKTVDFEYLGSIPTGDLGLTGITVGPQGKIWCTNRVTNQLFSVEAGELNTNTSTPIQNELLNITPNPTNGLLYIEIHSADCSSTADLKIYDATGKLVLQQNDFQACSSIDMSHLANGIYSVRLQSKDLIANQKVFLSK